MFIRLATEVQPRSKLMKQLLGTSAAGKNAFSDLRIFSSSTVCEGSKWIRTIKLKAFVDINAKEGMME